MRVLFVSAEIPSLREDCRSKDPLAAFLSAQKEMGVDLRVLSPGYRQTLEQAPFLRDGLRLGDPLGCGRARLCETRLAGLDVLAWLIDCPALYNRRGGLLTNEGGRAWADNPLRFALLNHVAAGIALEPGAAWKPDIVHANNWHAGLVPLLLAAQGASRPSVVLTINDFADQGRFGAEDFTLLGLHPTFFSDLAVGGDISFLKAGIQASDVVTIIGAPDANAGSHGPYPVRSEEAIRAAALPAEVVMSADDAYRDQQETAARYIARSPSLQVVNTEALLAALGWMPSPPPV